MAREDPFPFSLNCDLETGGLSPGFQSSGNSDLRECRANGLCRGRQHIVGQFLLGHRLPAFGADFFFRAVGRAAALWEISGALLLRNFSLPF
jgi:hypothetical protein